MGRLRRDWVMASRGGTRMAGQWTDGQGRELRQPDPVSLSAKFMNPATSSRYPALDTLKPAPWTDLSGYTLSRERETLHVQVQAERISSELDQYQTADILSEICPVEPTSFDIVLWATVLFLTLGFAGALVVLLGPALLTYHVVKRVAGRVYGRA